MDEGRTPSSVDAFLAQYDERLISLVDALWRRVRWSAPGCEREDWRQEARLGLLQARRQLEKRPREKWAPYADACVRNLARHLIRAATAHRAHEGFLEELRIVAELPVELVDPHLTEWDALHAGGLIEQLDRDDIAAALGSLAPHEREIIELYYGAGLTDVEMAVLLVRRPRTITSRRQRALKKMREFLRTHRAEE